MSRSGSPDTIDTQIWKPLPSDQIPRPQPTEREYRPQFLSRRDFRRLPSTESYKSYSTIGSFTLDDAVDSTSSHPPKPASTIQPHLQLQPSENLASSPPTLRQSRSSRSFTLEDSSISTTQKAVPHAKPHGEDSRNARRRSSVESFETTGSFALDESTARRWEIEHGWPWLSKNLPSRERQPAQRPHVARNFSRPLRQAPPSHPQQDETVQNARVQPPPVTSVEVTQIQKPHQASVSQEPSATSSSETTYRSSLTSETSSSSSSSASSIILREEDYPAYPRNFEPKVSFKGKEPLRTPLPEATPGVIERREDSVPVRAPALTSRTSYPPLSDLRPPQPSRKQVSFEHSRAPPPSIRSPTPPPSIKASIIENPRPSTSSTSNSRPSAESRRTAPSMRSLQTAGSAASISVGSESSLSTQAVAEAWKASNYDISSLTPKELEKLKKRGVDPALWLEMKAATARKKPEQGQVAKEQKKSSRFRLGGRPLVGNAFIG